MALDFQFQGTNFSLKHTRNVSIRRQSNKIEDAFNTDYQTPNLISIPDEIAVNIPRISLSSKNGHSQISFSQISVDLAVNYTDEYVSDYQKCRTYFVDRVNKIIETLPKIGIENALYFGLVVQVNIPFSTGENPITQISEVFCKNKEIMQNCYDLSQRVSIIKDNKYFVNLSINNYRNYKDELAGSEIPDLKNFSSKDVIEEGISVAIDVNNRYSFNERGDTVSKAQFEIEFEKVLALVDRYISDLENILKTGVVEI